MSESNRGVLVSDAIRVVDWIRSRRFAFSVMEFCEALGFQRRTAQRWLAVAEGCGLVEHDDSATGNRRAGERVLSWKPAELRAAA